jgi:hypothetical protein
MATALLVLAVLGTIAVGAAPAIADEAKVPVSASMLLRIMAAPVEGRDAAYDRSLKEPGPAPRPPLAEVLPDGSVKMDRTVVTVRNPCPPGTVHYEPVPLPGRRAKN